MVPSTRPSAPGVRPSAKRLPKLSLSGVSFGGGAKLLLALMVLSLLVPSVRGRAASFLMEHGGFAFNPLRKLAAQDRAQTIAGYVKAESGASGWLPSSADLPRVVREGFPKWKGVETDPWGRPFYLRRTAPDAFRIGSAGPDRRAGTADDIFSGAQTVARRQPAAPAHASRPAAAPPPAPASDVPQATRFSDTNVRPLRRGN
jgi:hypothetical protein